MATTNFDEVASFRENFAHSISDLDISRNVVLKILQLSDESCEMKADILMSAIPDIGTIFAQLKYFNKNGFLSNKNFHDILEICIAKYHSNAQFAPFNPYNNFE